MKNTELSNIERVSRIVIGTGLIVFTLALNVVPLGWIALIPLVATYPVFTGMYGYDPVGQWLGNAFDYAVHASERILRVGHTPRHS